MRWYAPRCVLAPRSSLLIGFGLVLTAPAAGCRSDEPPPGVTARNIDDPSRYHVREGFVRLVPPAHLPSSSPDRDQVEIWVRLPEGGLLELSEDEAGRPTLEFPAGSAADRVEWHGEGEMRRIVDIRGTRLEDGGEQTFYVYRPTAPDPRASLFGLEWRRADPTLQRAATEHLVTKVAALPPVADMPEPRRAEVLEGVRGRNQCAGCHGLSRPENEHPRQHGLVDRGTDVSGFFTPRTVLWDEVPLEAYGAYDRSWNDPAIDVRCANSALTRGEHDSGRRCPDGSIARGRLRWDASELDAQQLLAAVCESRMWIADHMDDEDRAKLAIVLHPCKKN